MQEAPVALSGSDSSIHVLVLCSGDQCRSPMAAGLGQQYAASLGLDVVFRSASTRGIEGRPAHPRAVAVCAEVGVDISDHVSTGLGSELVEWADHVLVMESKHATALRSGHGRSAGGSLLYLGAFGGVDRIRSPLGGSTARHRRARDRIRRCVEAFLDQLQRVGPVALRPPPSLSRPDLSGSRILALVALAAAVGLVFLCAYGSEDDGSPCRSRCRPDQDVVFLDGECVCRPRPWDVVP